ncbi:MAG: hypothetical protein ACI4QR_06045 [Eubacteriales bacterium]
MKKEKILKKTFDKQKREITPDKLFHRLMIPSVLGILLCGVCLIGLTWAWFSDSASGNVKNLTTSNYNITVQITSENDNMSVNQNTDGSYTLSHGKKYNVTLTAAGNASTGYCKIKLNDRDFYTTQLPVSTSNTLSFMIDCSGLSEDTKAVFTPCWMTYSGYSETATDLIGQTKTEITSEDISGNT